MILDFATILVSIVTTATTERQHLAAQEGMGDVEAMLKPVSRARAKLYATATVDGVTANDMIDNYMYVFPQFGGVPRFELPECSEQSLIPLVHEYKEFFRVQPCTTSATFHHIPKNGLPIYV